MEVNEGLTESLEGILSQLFSHGGEGYYLLSEKAREVHHADVSVRVVQTFDEVGLPTDDRGVALRLSDGSEVLLTVQAHSRNGRLGEE